MLQPSACADPPLHHSKPQGNSGQKHNPPQWIIRHCSHSLNGATRGDSGWENNISQSVSSVSPLTLGDPMNWGSQASLSITNSLILAPNSWDAYQNNDLSEPRLFHLLIHKKALNPLRYLAFFKSNLLMLQLPCLPCKISYIFCPPPTPNPFYNPLCHHSLSELS